MTYSIRILTEEDIYTYHSSIINLLFICLDESMNGVRIGDSEKYYHRMSMYIKDGSALVLGVFNNDEIIGLQWVYEIDNFGVKRFHSSFNCVDPRYQGMKIGSSMMKKVEEIAKERNISAIEAMCSKSNVKAVQYHIHNGFEIERYKVVKKLL